MIKVIYGFMLTPTYDKLFDRGFITFDDEKRKEYLKYHREYVFKA